MFDVIFQSVYNGEQAVWQGFLICLAVALVTGVLLAVSYSGRAAGCSGSFFATLSILPAAVCLVIFAVNGNLGVGVAVAGAFGLVRFRSAPGSGREICAVFVGMAVGLTFGLGYLAYGVIFAVVSEAVLWAYTRLGARYATRTDNERCLTVTVPEDLNYTGLFEDLFGEYTLSHRLTRVKTTHMGSLYKLSYRVRLRDAACEKELLDKMRTRNGNLEISCAEAAQEGDL